VVDFDGEPGRAVLRDWIQAHGHEWAETRAVKTARGGHLWFKWPEGQTRIIRNSAGEIATGVDVRGEGGYVIVPPSIHPDGPAYTWAADPSTPIADAPGWLVELAVKASRQESPPGTPREKGNGHAGGTTEGKRNDALASLAGSMRRRGMDADAILAALLAHNAAHCDPPLPENEVRQIAASVARYQPAPEAMVWTEHDLTIKFTETYPNLRYVAPWGKWLLFARGGWRDDDVRSVFDHARAVCVEVSAGLDPKETGTLKSLRSAKTRAAIENMARSDPRQAATVDQWDRDGWILNTPGGTCDLRTGVLREHRAEDYLTKMTAVTPQIGDCPIWMGFLNRITAGDLDLQRYLQRVVGYSFTADISEHALFFFYGTGSNGKGVFTGTVHGIHADYAQVAQMEVFTENKNDRHPTELAALRGARLVIASEIDAGRRMAEGRVKSLTGGDPIRARFCRCDEFEFTPTFKLMLAGNHKPALRSVDEAIRRRVHLVPFTVTIPPEERDLKLGEKLRSEWPQILQWAIDGCLAWQREGLNPPKAVRDATAEYFATEDAILSWQADRCIVSPQVGSTKSSLLYQDYKAWAERTGEFCGSQKRFSQDLIDRGFKSYPSNGVRFEGIKLRDAED
jgi:putative DNA primase/helicase